MTNIEMLHLQKMDARTYITDLIEKSLIDQTVESLSEKPRAVDINAYNAKDNAIANFVISYDGDESTVIHKREGDQYTLIGSILRDDREVSNKIFNIMCNGIYSVAKDQCNRISVSLIDPVWGGTYELPDGDKVKFFACPNCERNAKRALHTSDYELNTKRARRT